MMRVCTHTLYPIQISAQLLMLFALLLRKPDRFLFGVLLFSEVDAYLFYSAKCSIKFFLKCVIPCVNASINNHIILSIQVIHLQSIYLPNLNLFMMHVSRY